MLTPHETDMALYLLFSEFGYLEARPEVEKLLGDGVQLSRHLRSLVHLVQPASLSSGVNRESGCGKTDLSLTHRLCSHSGLPTGAVGVLQTGL